ncbi:hypothetical protein, partial [uncultured Dubosiella sp.]
EMVAALNGIQVFFPCRRFRLYMTRRGQQQAQRYFYRARHASTPAILFLSISAFCFIKSSIAFSFADFSTGFFFLLNIFFFLSFFLAPTVWRLSTVRLAG